MPHVHRHCVLNQPINLTTAVGRSSRGIVVRCEGGTNTGHPSIRLRHTGHGFDLTGSGGHSFENCSIDTEAGSAPKTAFLLARNSDAASAGRHRFYNVKVYGSFTEAILYNYGSEEVDVTSSTFTNLYERGAAKVVTITANNVRRVTSGYTTSATGNQSTLVHNFFGGSYRMASGHAQADVLYLEGGKQRPCVRRLDVCRQCARQRPRARLRRHEQERQQQQLIHRHHRRDREVHAAVRLYFGDTKRAVTGWTISAARVPSHTRALFAHANVTLDNLHISQINEAAARGIEAGGTIQKSWLNSADLLVRAASSSQNVYVMPRTNQTRASIDRDTMIDTAQRTEWLVAQTNYDPPSLADGAWRHDHRTSGGRRARRRSRCDLVQRRPAWDQRHRVRERRRHGDAALPEQDRRNDRPEPGHAQGMAAEADLTDERAAGGSKKR